MRVVESDKFDKKVTLLKVKSEKLADQLGDFWRQIAPALEYVREIRWRFSNSLCPTAQRLELFARPRRSTSRLKVLSVIVKIEDVDLNHGLFIGRCDTEPDYNSRFEARPIVDGMPAKKIER